MTRKPRRILFARAIDVDNVNAQSSNARHILRHWRSRDWRPSAITFGDPDPGVASNPHVDIINVRPDRYWPLRIWQVYQQDFDAIFYPGIHHRADYWGLRSRARAGRRVPIIATIEGLVGTVSDNNREEFYSVAAGHPVFCQNLPAAHLARVEWINTAADYLVAISPFLGRMATTRYGGKVSQLPLGVDLSLFWNSALQRGRGRPRVVCAGNAQAHKRPHIFLRLAREFPDADFVWFGQGDMRDALVADANRLPIKNLLFPGVLPPPDLAREFASAEIFVLPSRSEGLPKVTQEAAAAGLAQIVFGFFETPSVVDGENGFVVWDDAQLAARLAQLLKDRELVERMGRAGVKMSQDWSWERTAELWERRIIQCAECSPLDIASLALGPGRPPAP